MKNAFSGPLKPTILENVTLILRKSGCSVVLSFCNFQVSCTDASKFVNVISFNVVFGFRVLSLYEQLTIDVYSHDKHPAIICEKPNSDVTDS